MFVYRGEKFADKGYMHKAKLEHKQHIAFGVEYHTRELEKIKEEKERFLIEKKDEVSKYELYTKPVSELTQEEKMMFINAYWNFLGRKNPKDGEISDLEVEDARNLMTSFNKHPLAKFDWEIEYHKEQLENVKTREGKTFCIGLDSQSITRENIDAIKKNILELKNTDAEIHVAIDGNMHERLNDSKVNYLYSEEEIKLLCELDSFLKDNNIDSLKFCEVTRIDRLEDYKQGWTLNQVVNANNKIDEIAEYIKDNSLSPFEAMLYIHKWASTFKYNGSSGAEEPRVLPSILNSNKIVCSGYASLVKAVVDKLNMPGLKCDLVGCSIIDGKRVCGHCHNIVSIKDNKYGIDGTYVEDACWDIKKEGYEQGRGFAHCLYSVNDVKHFNNGVRYYNEEVQDRFSNLLFDSQEFVEGMKNMNASRVKQIIYSIKEYLRLRQTPDLIKKYGKNSFPIPLEKYKEALEVVYSKIYDDPKKVEERVAQELENSKITGVKNFNIKSGNVFSNFVTNKERMVMKKEMKGPSATQ